MKIFGIWMGYAGATAAVAFGTGSALAAGIVGVVGVVCAVLATVIVATLAD